MNFDMKRRVFRSILYTGILFSISAICVNLSTRLPLHTNIKWGAFLLLCSLFLLLNKKYPYSDKIPFILFLIIIVFYMPFAFVSSGGGRGDFLAYAFFALIALGYMTKGIYQKVLFAALIAMFIILHIFDYAYPEMIPVYDAKSRFYDRLIQVPILLIISYAIIKTFTDAYDESNDRLYYYANYDVLTGLLSRWGFSEHISKGFNTVYQDGILLLIDIDNFKLINDRRGHKVGDEVIKRFGEILQGYFGGNKKNLLCRWGGDEFIVLSFDSEKELDKLMEGVSREFLDYISNIEPLVDISIGSVHIKNCRSVDDLLTLADQFMYNQKRAKRKI